MFEGKNIVNVFPCPIWVHKLQPDYTERINGKAQDLIASIKADTPNIKPGEAWQTPHDLQDRAELGDLMDCAKAATRGILELLRVQYDSFVITGCWANIKPKGSLRHPMHTHANNYLSGVYYVRVPKGGDSIVFKDPRPQTTIISPPVGERNEYNSIHATLTVETGLLIMFPSWLAHSVEPNQGDEERISISFNVMFTEYGERMSKPKWQPRAAAEGSTPA